MTARTVRLLVLATTMAACKPAEDPNALKETWADTFERTELGPDWKNTGGNWAVKDGALQGYDCFNHPVWLNKVLPRDVRVELDIWTTSPEGDLKVEMFGDGNTFDPDKGSYTASGYVMVFGGWKNTQSKIARRDEHRNEDPSRRDVRVEPGKKYHWSIQRKDGLIEWRIDGAPFLQFRDVDPLAGPGRDHFGVGNWQTPVFVDNLVITPL
ncbi:MAG: hypothetical protein HY904_15640 [Deltaproteobacteria bacterium]|nr:hypothetical protein [Deltaproteobacteria bacterium]